MPLPHSTLPGRRTMLALLAAAPLAAAMTGCIVVPARGYAGGGEVVVNTPPPAPQVEVYGPPPALGWIWLAGYWGWAGGRHSWVPGHWEAGRPGHRWVPHHWVGDGGRWRLQPGRWERH